MDTVDTHYKLSIRLMTFLGIWPYVYSKFRFIRFFSVNLVVGLLIFAQSTALVRLAHYLDISLIIQNLCFVMISIGNLSKFNSFMKNGDAIRYLMDSIKNTCNQLQGDTLEIFDRRSKLGKKQSINFIILVYPGAIILILCRIASYLVVITAPPEANITDPFPVLVDYVVSYEKYFSIIALLETLAFFLLGTIPAATETVYIMWLQHGTCLFEIASYYFKKAMEDRPSTTSVKEMEVYRHECFASAVKYQNEGYELKELSLCTVSGILELSLSLCLGIELTFSFQTERFVGYVKDTFQFSYGFLILIAVITLGMNLFRISFAVRVTHDTQEICAVVILTIEQFFYMYYLNYLMQSVGDYAAGLGEDVYNQPWHGISVTLQKSVALVLLGSSKTITFDYYGFYSATLEGFSSLVKLSMSYFTIMVSFQSDD